MKFVIYLGGYEVLIATPESERKMVQKIFGEQGSLRSISNGNWTLQYRRIEFDADYLVGGIYGPRACGRPGLHMGIEGDLSRDLFLADEPIPEQEIR